jgi:DNA polymerase III subunit delta
MAGAASKLPPGMPSSPTRPFCLVCGQDDFLVGRAGAERFEAMGGNAADEFSREVISGFADTVDDVAVAVGRFREAVQTMPMFGGRRFVWLKDVNFLGDNALGRYESTQKAVEDLQAVLESVNPEETAVLVTASPVDRRRTFAKWCEKTADFQLAGAPDEEGSLAPIVLAEARAIGVEIDPDALELLLAKIGPNSRLLTVELRKLADHTNGARIEESHVAEVTPNVAQGEFFEIIEAFYSGSLSLALEGIRRHYFAKGDARPILAALQNRNRLMLQIRALVDAGEVRVGPRGLDGLPRAAQAHAGHLGEAAGEKTSFNVFAQNPWYMGKLSSGKLPTLRRLIDNQREFVNAFEEVIRRPAAEQEEVMRDLAVRCIAG